MKKLYEFEKNTMKLVSIDIFHKLFKMLSSYFSPNFVVIHKIFLENK